MEERKPLEFKPWMWIALLVALLLVVFDFDPVGDGLEKIFGKGASKYALSIILSVFIIYTFVKKK